MARPVHPYFIPSVADARGNERLRSGRPIPLAPNSSQSLAGMLLAAVVAALLVVADQLIETWADGHLLVVWVALWTVAFAALALLAPPMRQLTDATAVLFLQWSRARAGKRMDAVMWQAAQQDHRVMRELQMARLRSEYEA